ncbi:MAG: PKD domain-containing protein, partial [Ginsengibacter sp.]
MEQAINRKPNPNMPQSVTYKFLLLWGCIFFYSSNTFSQVTANFDASPVSGCAPLLVSFKDLSTGNPNYWMWDLGNGTTSFNQNSSTTYITPGTYTVKLVVKNNSGADSIIRNQYITVYASPVVKFSGSPTGGCLPLTTQFKDESITKVGSIAKWQWDFGDGNSSSIQDPNHVYTSNGNYNVSLRVTSTEGCISSLTNESFIKIDTPAIPKFTASEVNFCNAPASVQFANTTTGKAPLTFMWDFGDGNTSSLVNPNHVYNNKGNYTVILTVTNSTGCKDTLTKTNFVQIDEVKAAFELPPTICKGTSFLINNTSSPVPSKVIWDFGDGTTSTAISPTKTFSALGNFTIKLITYFGDCKDSLSQSVVVMDKPKSSFTANDSIACKSPFVVDFTNTSTNAVTYSWDYGDGSSDVTKNPTHTYTNGGIFTVTLITFNASGCSDTIIKKNFIQIKIPEITANLPAVGCVPFTHKFSPTISPAANIQSYFWDFGDGTSSPLQSPTHTFSSQGRYNIILTVTTKDGCTNTKEFTSGIIVGVAPNADFVAAKNDVCANESVIFSDLSTGSANEWLWLFGDGTSSSAQNPIHTYGDTGSFTIKLTTINDGCASVKTIPQYIHVKGPIANFSSTQDCAILGQTTFKDASIIPETWSWDFGDGITSNLQNPTHVFATTGNYSVALTVKNSTTGCVNTNSKIVKIINEKADFSISNPKSCKNLPIAFSVINSAPINISSYTWRFGNGVSRTTPSTSYSYTYPEAGTYNVTLIITDLNGCKDSITKPFAVEINGPTSVFRAIKPVICVGGSSDFFDSSYSDKVTQIVQWEWNWGDGVTESFSAPPFAHTYNNPGNYNVSLKVTDAQGCSDTRNKLNEVIVPNVVANFKTDTLSCTTKLVTFQNNSFGTGLTHNWDFGDGTNSTIKNPQHLYTTEGTYNVSLIVKDENGCTSQISKPNLIKIANPIADFSADVTYSFCPPLVTQFTNNSSNYFSSSWNFGDKTSSTAKDPSHFYNSVGKFQASLTVTGAEGCESSKSIQIEVKGPTGLFTYDNLVGCHPLETNFSARTFENKKFIWDFNDGTTIATLDSNVSHTYNLPGKYIPKIILIDESDCQVPIEGSDTIFVFGVTANFNSNTNLVCSMGDVAFQDSSISNDIVTNYKWTFGDGSTSAQKNPLHNYNVEGKYFPSLSVITQEGCKDTLINKLRIDVNRKPIIAIGGPDGACVSTTLTFNGIHSNPDTSTLSWNWNFANGNVSQLKNPDPQTYSKSGIFPIKASVLSSNGCTDSVTKNIEIFTLPMLSIQANNPILCRGNSTSL